ncbi:MAG: hypothetical protein ACFFCD_13825 [Promethearchaeota archaeon]
MPIYETTVTLKGKLNEELDLQKHTEMLINTLKKIPELENISIKNRKSYYGHWTEIQGHIDMFGSLSSVLKKIEEGAPYNLIMRVSRNLDANSFEDAQKMAYDWLKKIGQLLENDMNLKISI